MLKYELKKILLYRRGIWLLLAVIAAEITGMLLFTTPFDPILEENREVYERYLTRMEGPLTEEKQSFIEEKMQKLSENRRKLTDLETDFYSGKIDEAEFRPAFQRLSAVDQEYAGVSKLYSQYIFVREDVNRNFLYTGGWEILLGTQQPLYLVLLMTVFLSAPVFCQEYISQMDVLLLTQKRSSRLGWKAKILAVFLLIGTVTAILEGSRLLYCATVYGLPNWNYSLQSVFSFGGTSKEMPLWSAWLLQFLLKELGYISCCAWVIFFAVLLQKYSMTLMAGIVFLVIPFLTVGSNTLFLRIPGPWALTIGSIYLNAPSFYQGPSGYGSWVPVEFKELGWLALGFQVLFVGCVLLVILQYVRQKSSNVYCRRFRRDMKAILGLCLLILTITGCSKPNSEQMIYNSFGSGSFENNDVLIIQQPDTEGYQLIHKTDWKNYPFPLRIEENGYEDHLSFFQKNGKIFYFMPYEKRLQQMNLHTMEESVVKDWNKPFRWFFSLLPRKTSSSTINSDPFFLHGNAVYGIDNGELFCRDLLTGREERRKHIRTEPNFAYDGENIYYLDQYSRLVQENLDTGEKKRQENVVAEFFLLAPEGVYFLNRQQENILCLWDGEKVSPLDDTENGYRIYRDDNYLWLETKDSHLIRLDHGGSQREKIEFSGFISHIGPGDFFYVNVYSAESSHCVIYDKQTLEPFNISK